MDHLINQSQELIRLGTFHKDASSKVSDLAVRLLEKRDPSLKLKARLEEEDWESNKELTFGSVMALPQSRDDKAPTKWEPVSMMIKRIPDERGVSSRITVKHPLDKKVSLTTP